MNRNPQIPNRKLTLSTTEEISIEAGVVLGLSETKQLALMEVNFLT
jgi:hypothetical protein